MPSIDYSKLILFPIQMCRHHSLNNGVQIPQLGLGTQIQKPKGNGASETLNEIFR
jgi:hypothetical protein